MLHKAQGAAQKAKKAAKPSKSLQAAQAAAAAALSRSGSGMSAAQDSTTYLNAYSNEEASIWKSIQHVVSPIQIAMVNNSLYTKYMYWPPTCFGW